MDRVLTCILNEMSGSNSAAEAQALIGRMGSERGWEVRFLLSSTGADRDDTPADVPAPTGQAPMVSVRLYRVKMI
jgi:hypothetical protein